MPVLAHRFFGLFPLLPILAGCSGGGDSQGAHREFNHIQEAKQSGFLDRLSTGIKDFKTKFITGRQALEEANEIMREQPALLKILQGDATEADWRGLDKDYLRRKAEDLKKFAESAGIPLDREPTPAQRALLEKARGQLDIPPKRSAELEEIIRRRRERMAEKQRTEGGK